MTELKALIKRNCKIFFKDKTMFLTSLITPMILLVLYVSFLKDVYKDVMLGIIPSELLTDKKIIDGIVGGQLVSSLLAVSCVTVAFCSNFLMVQDKASGAGKDLYMTPVKRHAVALGYFISSAAVTLIICYSALLLGLVYLLLVGWYLTFTDVLLLCLDVLLLVLFGTALSSLINCNLKTNGQVSAVGTIVSSGYGFICGAYMPISNFGVGLQRVISFLPGTYATSLLRNHAMRSSFDSMNEIGIPDALVDEIKKSLDCELYFFDRQVPLYAMYIILVSSVALITAMYTIVCKKRIER